MGGKVICAGAIVADMVARSIPAIPAAGASAKTPEISLNIGGCAANAATGLARLGRDVQLCGAVGEDDLGNYLARALAAEGVGLDLFQQKIGQRTGTTFVINTDGEDRRFISDTGANDCAWPEEVPSEALADVAVLSVHAHGLSERPHVEDLLRWFKDARDQGTLTVLDVIYIPGRNLLKELEELLPYVDVFTPNDEEIRKLFGEMAPDRALQRCLDMGVGTAVITRGENGVIWQDSDGVGDLQAPEVDEVDGTGCGDAFVAGWIDAHLDGLPIREKMLRGSLMGASAALKPGAIAGLPDRSQLNSMFRNNSSLLVDPS